MNFIFVICVDNLILFVRAEISQCKDGTWNLNLRPSI